MTLPWRFCANLWFQRFTTTPWRQATQSPRVHFLDLRSLGGFFLPQTSGEHLGKMVRKSGKTTEKYGKMHEHVCFKWTKSNIQPFGMMCFFCRFLILFRGPNMAPFRKLISNAQMRRSPLFGASLPHCPWPLKFVPLGWTDLWEVSQPSEKRSCF